MLYVREVRTVGFCMLAVLIIICIIYSLSIILAFLKFFFAFVFWFCFHRHRNNRMIHFNEEHVCWVRHLKNAGRQTKGQSVSDWPAVTAACCCCHSSIIKFKFILNFLLLLLLLLLLFLILQYKMNLLNKHSLDYKYS